MQTRNRRSRSLRRRLLATRRYSPYSGSLAPSGSGKFERYRGEIGFDTAASQRQRGAEDRAAKPRPSDGGFLDLRGDAATLVWGDRLTADEIQECEAAAEEDDHESDSEAEWVDSESESEAEAEEDEWL